MHAPTMINYLCLLYFVINEKFNAESMAKIDKNALKLSSSTNNKYHENDMVETQPSSDNGGWFTAYGDNIIDVNKNANCIITWTIKIYKAYCAIGIDSSDCKMINDWCFNLWRNKSQYYGWGYSGQLHAFKQNVRYNSGFKDGDIIKMELNLQSKSLKYYVNDNDMNFGFDDIDITKTYRLAISLFVDQSVENVKVQILDFNIMY